MALAFRGRGRCGRVLASGFAIPISNSRVVGGVYPRRALEFMRRSNLFIQILRR